MDQKPLTDFTQLVSQPKQSLLNSTDQSNSTDKTQHYQLTNMTNTIHLTLKITAPQLSKLCSPRSVFFRTILTQMITQNHLEFFSFFQVLLFT